MGEVTLPFGVDPRRMLFDLERDRCERSLVYFIKRAWHVLEPASEYLHNWHIDMLSEHLEAITNETQVDGRPYNRLLINVPPGPMREDSIVETARGPVALKNVRVGDLVLTHLGRYRNVSAVHEQGVLPILRIVTNSGRVTHASPSHPYLTPKGWVEAKNLNVGDVLAVVNRQEDRPFASSLRDEEARLLGYIVGDGSVTHACTGFTNADREVIEDFKRCAEAMGFHTAESNRGKFWQVRVNGGSKVQEWLRSHGLQGASSYTKRIPPAVMNANMKTIATFMGAYWTCDGGFDVRPTKARGSKFRAYGTTVSAGLAQDIVFALALLGVDSRLRAKARSLETAAQPGGVYRSYSIEIQREHMTALFADMPGLCSRKRELAAQCVRLFHAPIWNDEIISIEPEDDARCLCLTVDEDHSFTCSGIAVSNSMKSLLVNVLWPSWEWGPKNKPHLRYLCVAHKIENLSERDAGKMFNLVTSDWYQSRWGDRVKLTNDAKMAFHTAATGFRIATSIAGVTGIRADRLLIDDPHSVKGATSETTMKGEVDNFLEAMPTRVNDPVKSAIVVIKQRLAESDVSGVILDELNKKRPGTWDHVMLPMRFDPRRAGPTLLGTCDPREEDGELFFPERFTQDTLERDEIQLGPYGVAAQWQQEPAPRGGGVIKDDWWKLWTEDKYPPLDFVCASLDTAYTTKQENDFSALTIWGVFSTERKATVNGISGRYGRFGDVEAREYGETAPQVIMLYAWQKRLEFPDLVQMVSKDCKRFAVDLLLVESKSAGISLAQELRRAVGHESFGVQLIDPKGGDKLARLYSVQHIFAEGIVHAPDKEWAEMVISQVRTFPKGKHDDLVDTVSQALRFLRDAGLLTRAPERIAEIDASMRHIGRAPPPLYAT